MLLPCRINNGGGIVITVMDKTLRFSPDCVEYLESPDRVQIVFYPQARQLLVCTAESDDTQLLVNAAVTDPELTALIRKALDQDGEIEAPGFRAGKGRMIFDLRKAVIRKRPGSDCASA